MTLQGHDGFIMFPAGIEARGDGSRNRGVNQAGERDSGSLSGYSRRPHRSPGSLDRDLGWA